MQVGLLISDSAGNTATARKTFSISSAPATASPVPNSAAASGSLAPPGTSSSVNVAPIIKQGLNFAVAASDSFAINGVADPDGDSVLLKWALMEEATGKTVKGNGTRVTVSPSAAPGSYELLITADDGRGGVSEAVAKVAVAAKKAVDAAKSQVAAAAAGAANAVAAAVAAKVMTVAPSIYGGRLATVPKLPTLTFYQGAVLDVDAAVSGLFNLSSPDWQKDLKASTCKWTLKGSGAAAAGGATVYGCSTPARFRLHTPGSFTLTLDVSKKGGKSVHQTSAITVNPKPFWSDYYSPSAPEGFPSGRCGANFFSGKEFNPLNVSCGGVSLPLGWGAEVGLDNAQQQLAFSWKLTPLTQRAASGHKQPLTRASQGRSPASFGAVAPGLYQAEVVGAAGGAGGGSASSIHTVYYLSGLLLVEPSAKLKLTPPSAPCAGKALQLAPAPLALLAGQKAGPARWKVTWVDAANATGKPLVLTGSGSSFSFVAQPGKYNASVTVDVTDGGVTRRLTGKASLTARPCVTCVTGRVALKTKPSSCKASSQDAVKLLASPKPAWLSAAKVEFAPKSNLGPGTRALTVIARALGSNVTANCTVKNVTIQDTTPPVVKVKKAGGECLAPANGMWACWGLSDLVNATDGCSSGKALQFQSTCGAGTGAEDCKVLANGRVCLRADAPAAGADNRTAHFDVLFRDGAGNVMKAPVKVPLTVFRDGSSRGCGVPALSGPS